MQPDALVGKAAWFGQPPQTCKKYTDHCLNSDLEVQWFSCSLLLARLNGSDNRNQPARSTPIVASILTWKFNGFPAVCQPQQPQSRGTAQERRSTLKTGPTLAKWAEEKG
mmetsp:Transcript_90663/g.227976  ORF Transcript_90663/g.227976 Transcript_90663/m.227976 type:complete len:110 (-) Transcript_90663:966-1295(-)